MKYKVKKFIRKNPLAAVGIVIWFVFILCAIFAPLLAPYDPAVQDLSIRNNAPSAAHWFGTDSLGRDVLSRVIYGSRISIPSGILVVILACAFGGLYGAVAGYFGKAVDEILMRFADMVMSFPGDSAGDVSGRSSWNQCYECDSGDCCGCMAQIRPPDERNWYCLYARRNM